MRLIDLIDKSVGDRDHLDRNITTFQDVATWSFLNGVVCEPHRLLKDLEDFSKTSQTTHSEVVTKTIRNA